MPTIYGLSKSKVQGSVRKFLGVGLTRKLPNIRLICINRPGKGSTSLPHKRSHLDTTVKDAVVVLDSFGIDRVNVLCMCAGASFAMAFCMHHKERTTGRFMAIAGWVHPADCGYKNTKLSLYLGSRMPSVISPLAGSVMSSLGLSLSSFPTSWAANALKMKLNNDEEKAFDEMHQDNKDEFSKMMKWVLEEKGGQSADVNVLLSGGMLDYQKFGESLNTIILWHGTKDTMVSYASAQWLVEQVPGATLNTIPDATHDGCNFLLYPSIVESIQSFVK